MVNPHKRVCKVCGNIYSYCPQCKEDFYKPTWYFMFCSETCKNIFEILSACEVGNLSLEETKLKLEAIVNDENLQKFDAFMREQIQDILSYSDEIEDFSTEDKQNTGKTNENK